MREMFDIHSHIIPGVDDGATDIHTAETMLRSAIYQGITAIVATSHAATYYENTEKSLRNYRRLKKIVEENNLPIELYLGSEVYCRTKEMDFIIENLNSGRIPSMNGTRYVLAEFWYPDEEEFIFCLNKLLEHGWIPIIAHAERYPHIDLGTFVAMKEAGCLIQINAYSIVKERYEIIREKALELLEHRLVDLLGSDAHGITHRPVDILKAIEYLESTYEEEYVDKILTGNAKEILLSDTNLDITQNDNPIEETPWLNAIAGVLVGDALGVPVQFLSREELREAPITSMDGFGTFDMPPGSWSDDGSMTLATLDSLLEKGQIDLYDIMCRFKDWFYNGAYTPLGFAYDQGHTCSDAIMNFTITKDVKSCGKTGPYANGNGALMRIMPVCLFVYEKEKEGSMTLQEAVEWIHEVSALTHNHLRSKIACGIYYFLVKEILNNKEQTISLYDIIQTGLANARTYYKQDIRNYTELAYYNRMFDTDDFANLPDNEIKSSGYVVDSIEAAIWCLLNSNSFEKATLLAVNLGKDTDTVAAIAGGLAGLFYGYNSIPEKWLKPIRKLYKTK